MFQLIRERLFKSFVQLNSYYLCNITNGSPTRLVIPLMRTLGFIYTSLTLEASTGDQIDPTPRFFWLSYVLCLTDISKVLVQLLFCSLAHLMTLIK